MQFEQGLLAILPLVGAELLPGLTNKIMHIYPIHKGILRG